MFGCLFVVEGCVLVVFVAGCLLMGRCLPFVVCLLLLFVVCCLLFVALCSWLVACSLLLFVDVCSFSLSVVRCVLLVVTGCILSSFVAVVGCVMSVICGACLL